MLFWHILLEKSEPASRYCAGCGIPFISVCACSPGNCRIGTFCPFSRFCRCVENERYITLTAACQNILDAVAVPGGAILKSMLWRVVRSRMQKNGKEFFLHTFLRLLWRQGRERAREKGELRVCGACDGFAKRRRSRGAKNSVGLYCRVQAYRTVQFPDGLCRGVRSPDVGDDGGRIDGGHRPF